MTEKYIFKKYGEHKIFIENGYYTKSEIMEMFDKLISSLNMYQDNVMKSLDNGEKP